MPKSLQSGYLDAPAVGELRNEVQSRPRRNIHPGSLFRILSSRALPRVRYGTVLPPLQVTRNATGRSNIEFSYAISTLTAGLPPQDFDFEEAMELVGLKGEDRKTYAINSQNTRVRYLPRSQRGQL